MTEFKFPMSVRERVMGMVYIIFHSAIIPYAVAFVNILILQPSGMGMSEAQITLVVYVIGFIYCLISMFKYLKTSFSDIFDRPAAFLVCIAVGFFACIAMSLAVSWILVAMKVTNLTNPNSETVNVLIGEDRGLIIAAAVLFAPIIEECMFRGALFGTIRLKNRALAYIVTMFAFSMYHLWQYFIVDYSPSLWLYMLQYVPHTIVLCRAYEISGSIWCPIFLHGIINAVALMAV